MRARLPDEAQLAAAVPVEHQGLAEDSHGLRWVLPKLGAGGDGVPVTPEQLSHGRPRADPGEVLVLLNTEHAQSSSQWRGGPGPTRPMLRTQRGRVNRTVACAHHHPHSTPRSPRDPHKAVAPATPRKRESTGRGGVLSPHSPPTKPSRQRPRHSRTCPAVIPAKAGIQGGRGVAAPQPSPTKPSRQRPRESGNPGEGPQAGGACFTYTTSPSTGSYARVSESGSPLAPPPSPTQHT